MAVELVSGEHYLTATCKRCKKLMWMKHIPGGRVVVLQGHGRAIYRCEHCGKVGKYPADQIATTVWRAPEQPLN
jgi:RNase P subunit RPR2